MTADLETRLQRVEDELAIQRLIMTYGPAADAGLTSFAGALWLEDGVYDWDAHGDPHQGSAGVDAMLQTDGHQGLIGKGAAHMAMPPVVEIDGDTATALNYSLVLIRQGDGYNPWRASAVRWDLERSGSSWRVRRRTNRLLSDTGGGRQLFGETLQELFGEGPR